MPDDGKTPEVATPASQIDIAKVQTFKDQGNEYFKSQNYLRALFSYSEAIEIFDDNDDESSSVSTTADKDEALDPDARKLIVSLLSNRSFCNIKLENFGSAISDSTRALEVDPSFTKAYYRRGCAKSCLMKFKEAKSDFAKVVKASPNDKDARAKLAECDKEMKRDAFLRAIATEDTKPISERIDMNTIETETSYDGPVFAQPVTEEFLDAMTTWQEQQKSISKKSAYEICFAALELFKAEKSIVHVSVPPGTEFTVCGDVHGQYYDLINIFKINGKPSEKNPYLFNGDFVDRGSFSMECILLLFAYKVAYPKHLYLARGNHETKAMNKLYGFSGEVTAKFDERLYELFSEAFCYLPLGHVLQHQVFCVHGGLFSRDDVELAELERIDRNCEPPDSGLMVEMLWSDPQPGKGRAPSKRGVGVAFGPDVTNNFLGKNNLKMVVRSHEMKEKGYEVEHGGKLVTIFSAPNYCDQMGNQGAYIRFKSDVKCDLTPHYTSFAHVPHPGVRAMQYANRAFFGPMFGGM
jgi:serine/threonine-protein phosphatase 5